MAKLSNPKHEHFALLRAKGMAQGKAYVTAGYQKNDGAASRLNKDPKVVDRIEELKQEVAVKIKEAIDAPSVENWETLAAMGIDKQWIVRQYKEIYEQSLSMGQFSAANTSIQNIQKLWELESRGEEGSQEAPENRVDINTLGNVLDKVTSLVAAAKAPDLSTDVPDPVMINITPKEEE